MPSGSKSSRKSDLIKTPKEARMPCASGCCFFSSAAVARSALVWAWKMMSKCCSRVLRVKSARGPLPKKMIFVVFIFILRGRG